MKSIGKKKYIWLKGGLECGFFMAISMTYIIQAIYEHFSLESFSNQNFITSLIINFVIFLIVGYIQSILLWRKYERKYNSQLLIVNYQLNI